MPDGLCMPLPRVVACTHGRIGLYPWPSLGCRSSHCKGLAENRAQSLNPWVSSPLQDELPERLLGTCRLEHLDLAAAAHLDLSTGKITRKVADL